jgi:hypothetical protein
MLPRAAPRGLAPGKGIARITGMRMMRLTFFLVLGAFALAACQNSPDWTVGKRELGYGFKIPH